MVLSECLVCSNCYKKPSCFRAAAVPDFRRDRFGLVWCYPFPMQNTGANCKQKNRLKIEAVKSKILSGVAVMCSGSFRRVLPGILKTGNKKGACYKPLRLFYFFSRQQYQIQREKQKEQNKQNHFYASRSFNIVFRSLSSK